MECYHLLPLFTIVFRFLTLPQWPKQQHCGSITSIRNLSLISSLTKPVLVVRVQLNLCWAAQRLLLVVFRDSGLKASSVQRLPKVNFWTRMSKASKYRQHVRVFRNAVFDVQRLAIKRTA